MQFDYQALRARLARLARTYARPAVADTALFGAVLFIVAGLAVVFALKLPFGWFVAGLAGPLIMWWAWATYELRVLTPVAGSTKLDDALEASLLGMLPERHSPSELAEIVAKLPAGPFFEARYGVSFGMLAAHVAQTPDASHDVWQSALELRDHLHARAVDSSILAAALVATMPARDTYLAQLRLDLGDIAAGTAWFHHIQDVVAEHKARRAAAGGIGRDWSFGYTPLLGHFGQNITERVKHTGMITRATAGREQAMNQIIQMLTSGGRRNVTLVGGLGCGKTSLVHALAQKLDEAGPGVPNELKYRQIVALDPSALIAQAKGRGELEDLVQHIFYEALTAKNTLLFLDDAQLFFEEGNGAVNIANVLLPVLEGGALQVILAMDEQHWLRISQANPALVQYLNRMAVVPPSESETMDIMQNQALLLEHQYKVTYMHQALAAAYNLSQRYGSDQVMPGRALRVMDAASRSAEHGLVTYRSVEHALEQMLGVRVATADTASERETLLNLEDLIHKRMINQKRAVQVVSDALRRARAGVRNPKRPIGTFLFLGPTGVGKTELAKSVAAVFFNGEDRLVRLDLNEFSGAGDVNRLIAAADQDEHSLTAQISRQPFSVVLLDEIEKAHPNVLNTLLQLLDEGILRDANNREVSFRDAVIIATSNAGADRLRQHIDAGEELEQFEQGFVNELIDQQVFRPEFLNRFDEIVLFRPLKPDELGQVIDLLLADVNKELASQRLVVAVEPEAKHILVQAGYDPRLGARPMRRVVQRAVENIVANQVLSGQVSAGQTVSITADDVRRMLNR